MSAESGKSKSVSLPFGKRRVNWKGEELAPRSLRSKHRIHYFLKDCTDEQLKKARIKK